MWSIWNEPNHPQFLQPLSERLGGKLTPSSPHIYRRLYVAAQGALERTGHGLGTDTVLFGEILPVGQRAPRRHQHDPAALFLREFFCLDAAYRPFAAARQACARCSPFPVIRTSGFAYHPYTKPAGPREPCSPAPTTPPSARSSASSARSTCIATTRRGRRGLSIYNTEFGLQTDPPDCVGFGTSLNNQAAFINEAEYVSFTPARA